MHLNYVKGIFVLFLCLVFSETPTVVDLRVADEGSHALSRFPMILLEYSIFVRLQSVTETISLACTRPLN